MAAACVFVDAIGLDFGRLTLYLPFAPCSMKNLFLGKAVSFEILCG